MSLTYTTTKGNRVSIDYQQWYYDWKDIREYVRWDTNECKVYLNLGKDYIEINETELLSDEISYLLGDKDFMEDFDPSEKEDWEKHMEYLKATNLISYFKIADLGSSWLYLRTTMDPEEANWFIIRKAKEGEEYPVTDIKETLDYFRAYIEWTFVEISIYSPTRFISEKDQKVKFVHYDFEDGERYFLSNEAALDSVDTKVRWEILKDTETENFSYRESTDN